MKYVSNKKCKEQTEAHANQIDDTDTSLVDVIESPNFIIFFKATRDGEAVIGQTESMQDEPDPAKVEAVTKLLDVGYSNIEIMAIETRKRRQAQDTSDNLREVDINEVFKD